MPSLRLSLISLLLWTMLSGVWAQSTPLVLQHADSMSFQRKVGKTALFGSVRFVHDSLVFKTHYAQWDRRKDEVDFKGGFSFDHPKGYIKAKRGIYSRRADRARAYHDVFMRDSLGEIMLYGDSLDYQRKKDFVKVWGSPKLIKAPSQEDIAQAQLNQSAQNELGSRIDTLTIEALELRYHQDTRQAQAWDSVVIHRGNLHVTCDSALFQPKKGYLKLSGQPVAQVGSYRVQGRVMEIWFQGESLKRIKVTYDAFGAQRDTLSKKNDIQWTEVEGDSMEVFFKKEDLDYLTVNGSGEGRFYDESTKQYINKVNGKSLKIDFHQSQPQVAKVRESARTQYFFFKDNGQFGGWNEAQGDSLDLNFAGSQLERISIKGNLASGVYMGAEKSKSSKSTKSKKSQKSSKSTQVQDEEAAQAVAKSQQDSSTAPDSTAKPSRPKKFFGKSLNKLIKPQEKTSDE